MSRHRAPDELLLEYAAGLLPEGPALAVATHVALDPDAWRKVRHLRGLGGARGDSEAGGALGEAALERALGGRRNRAPADASGTDFDWVPAPLRPLLAGKSWRRTIGGFDEIRLTVRGTHHRVMLLRLGPRRRLPIHRHTGAEYTVVLRGGYTDNTGNYGVGDFAVGPGPLAHEPKADPGEPCIALIVLEKPLVLTGMWARFLNPLLRLGWM